MKGSERFRWDSSRLRANSAWAVAVPLAYVQAVSLSRRSAPLCGNGQRLGGRTLPSECSGPCSLCVTGVSSEVKVTVRGTCFVNCQVSDGPSPLSFANSERCPTKCFTRRSVFSGESRASSAGTCRDMSWFSCFAKETLPGVGLLYSRIGAPGSQVTTHLQPRTSWSRWFPGT